MRPSGRAYMIVLAALVAVAGVALWLAGGGSDDPAAGVDDLAAEAAADSAEPRSVTIARPVDRQPAAKRRLELEVPDGTHPVISVRAGQRVPIHTEPGGGEVAEVVGAKTEFGSPTVFGVIETVGRWAGVSTPALGNEGRGWVRLDARRFDWAWTDRAIDVSLSERRASLLEGDEELHSFTVTIGAPDSPTPTGQFAITDVFRGGLNPVYGCCAVALSAIQPDLPSGWLGGNRIAFHGNGTGGPLGVAASNGCLRAEDDDVSLLVDEAVLGMPVFIRR